MDFKPTMLQGDSAIQDVIREKGAEFLDLHPSQLKELFIIRNLQQIQDKTRVDDMDELKKFRKEKATDSRYFYYPWLNKILKTASEQDFFTLKTNRNRDLISEGEQEKLKDFTVAVLGLSVGSNIAFLLTQAGISNKIFLADPDTLDTTNLNRLLTGLQDSGINKAVIAARKIHEANPYADAVPIAAAIDEERLEALLEAGNIRCIVEEVDSLPVKIFTRRLAMKYKVPVVMITDNGFSIVLHAERYDLGHDKIFEKVPAYWEKKLSSGLDHEKISQIIIEDIFGSVEKIDPKLFASNLRILRRELVSWPQLGSTAMLGGAAAMQMIMKIALGGSRDLFIKKFIHLHI
jgi:molybdopterin/thiamine biosynthesis adenylyltransferase